MPCWPGCANAPTGRAKAAVIKPAARKLARCLRMLTSTPGSGGPSLGVPVGISSFGAADLQSTTGKSASLMERHAGALPKARPAHFRFVAAMERVRRRYGGGERLLPASRPEGPSRPLCFPSSHRLDRAAATPATPTFSTISIIPRVTHRGRLHGNGTDNDHDRCSHRRKGNQRRPIARTMVLGLW